jgi:hypothetical protein
LPIGHVLSVRGSEASIGLPAPWPDDGARATVGKFLAIQSGAKALVGMIIEVSANHTSEQTHDYRALARIALMGEISRDAEGTQFFRRGVSDYPAIGDAATLVSSEQLRLIYTPAGLNTINIGQLNHDSSIAAHIDVDNLISKHFAILGSTGVGKSSGVTVILQEILRVRPDVRVFLLDGHTNMPTASGTWPTSSARGH